MPNLEERQLEISEKELELKREIFLADEKRKERESSSARKFKFNPVLATIFAALIGFVANTVGTAINNSNNITLEQRKFESDLIKKALDAATPDDKIKGLRLLLTLKLVHNDNLMTALNDFLKDTTKAREALTTSKYTPLSKDARAHFFEECKKEFTSPLRSEAVTNLGQIFDFISTDTSMKDTRYVAYILATIAHETDWTFQPNIEYGKGGGRYEGKMGNNEPGDGAKYCGRGYIQLTFKENYKRFNELLGLSGTMDDIVVNPDKVLEPVIAYRICSFGLLHGSFSGRKLTDYIHDTVTDYLNARRLINGMDKATMIASNATKFEKILKSCLAIDHGGEGAK